MPRTRLIGLVLLFAALILASCAATEEESAEGESPEKALAEAQKVELTPLLISQDQESVRPVKGSDAKTHLVYELSLVNATTLTLTVEQLVVKSGEKVVHEFGEEQVKNLIQVPSKSKPSPKIGPAQNAAAFVTVELANGETVPKELVHEVRVRAPGIPGGRSTSVGAATKVDLSAIVPELAPPLEPGSRYLALDSCCDSSRHIRSGLPLNNRLWYAQRFAIDWEQLNSKGTLSEGDPKKVANYEIYGKKVLAASDGTVTSTQDEFEDQVPGVLPGQSIGLEEADGNNIIINVGGGLYLNYAHLQKGSLTVKRGDTVRAGQVIGLVGNSGNSLAPHLHFHVMDSPSYLASNGEPYVIDEFAITGRLASTKNFDAAETTGKKPKVIASPDIGDHIGELPMDLSIVTFPAAD